MPKPLNTFDITIESNNLSEFFSNSPDLEEIMRNFRKEFNPTNVQEEILEESPQVNLSDSSLKNMSKETPELLSDKIEFIGSPIPTPKLDMGEFLSPSDDIDNSKMTKKVKSKFVWETFEQDGFVYFVDAIKHLDIETTIKFLEFLAEQDKDDEDDSQISFNLNAIKLDFLQFSDKENDDDVFNKNLDLIVERLKNGKLSIKELPEKFHDNKLFQDASKIFKKNSAQAKQDKLDEGNMVEFLDNDELWCLKNKDRLVYQDENKLLPRIQSEIIESIQRGKIANLDWLAADHKKNKEIVLLLVKHDGKNLKFANSSLQKDREVVKDALESNALAIHYVDSRLRSEIVCFCNKKTEERHFFFSNENMQQMQRNSNLVPYIYSENQNDWIVKKLERSTSNFYKPVGLAINVDIQATFESRKFEL